MKQTMQKIAIALCMALAFAACKNDDETGGGVESVVIEPTTLTLKVGETKSLTAKINGVASSEVEWSSDKPGIAEVDGNGKVTAVKEGDPVTITATAKADETKKATCIVTVTKKNEIGITLNYDALALELGKTETSTLEATVTGTNSQAVTWKSSDETVATVDGNGKVTAKKKGETTITVMANADTTKTATCKVTVVDKDEVMPEDVTLNKNDLSLKVDGTETLTAVITNADVVKEEYKKITWTSSNEKVATVNNGLVTAVGAGEAKITATTRNGKKAECAVTVTEPVTITLDLTTLTLKVDETRTLEATLAGTNSQAVTWQSSDTSVATVDSNGKVTAVKEGTATITVMADADKTKTATCTVKVESAAVVQPSGVTIAPTLLNLKVDDKKQLTATITNESDLDAEHKKITWTSSNEKVATVSDSGLVTAVGAGTATITATTTNEKSATCTVTVTNGTTTPVAASEGWDFVGKTDAPYSNLGTPKASGTGKDAQSLDDDIQVKSDKNQLTLVLSKDSTNVGETKTAPKYKYDSTSGLCIKGAALKIDNIKGLFTVTIQWYLGGSSDRNLEVTVGSGNTETKSSGTTVGNKQAYTDTFNGGNGTTLYIGASNELYIKSITITPQSGGTVTPNPDPNPNPDPDPTDKTISLTDTPLGYASLGTTYKTSGGKTVTTRSELLSAISSGGVIIINGMIDMSDGKLPAEGTKTDADMTGFDAFVRDNSDYTSYKALRDAYVTGCSESTNDKSSSSPESTVGKTIWSLNEKYGKLIKLDLQSNTTLVGNSSNSGIRGGSIQINGKQNIQIRNLTIKDAFDPFPHHEKNDGYNAQWDGINIQGASKNIWIDHCTLMDTCTLGFVKTGGSKEEKWQVYDGLCDIKGNSEYITVSNCKFCQHDKTMLIGNDDVENLSVTRTITLYRNYFFNCGQRLPMVRNSDIHILNNYYDYDGTWYLKDGQQYAIGVRANAKVYSEKNYFGNKISYSVSGTSDKTQGTLYRIGDAGKTTVKEKQFMTSDTPLFSPSYTLNKLEASAVPESVKASAGAGYTLKQ